MQRRCDELRSKHHHDTLQQDHPAENFYCFLRRALALPRAEDS